MALFRSPGYHALGSAQYDWARLGFNIQKVAGHVEFTWKDGVWDDGKFETNPILNTHIFANVFHYGQALFEGLKGFHGMDGKFRVFRDDENCARMRLGCQRLILPEVPREIWHAAIDTACRENKSFIPPYGSGSSLYIRPFIFGFGAQLGVAPAKEVKFIVAVSPVSSYYASGVAAIDAKVVEGYDRAAQKGTGNVKAAGNYAADLIAQEIYKQQGYPIGLYLDPIEGRYVEEFNTSNFVAIKDNTYITPKTDSILASITNKSLFELALDMDMKAERRQVCYSEVESFEEVGAVGTAVVVTPISSLTRGDHKVVLNSTSVLEKLRTKMLQIHFAEAEDAHGWLREIEL